MATPEVEKAVARWLQENPKFGWGEDVVPGTTEFERAELFALGGFANPLVYPRGRSQIEGWPSDILAWISAPEPPSDLVRDLREAAVASPAVLGSIYERVVKAPNRRRLGTFFTPPQIVEHMLDLAEHLSGHQPRVVVDPGAGVGAFSVPAVDRWRTDAIAVDVNPVTLGLLGIASVLRGQSVVRWEQGNLGRRARRVHLVNEDYLRWIGPFLHSAAPPRVLVLGNPPYTRHQSLNSGQKAEASTLSGDLVPSHLAGLSSYFLAVTLRNLRVEDSLVMLLPSNWLATRYGHEIRSHIWDLQLRPIELHIFPTELEVFAGTQVAAVILGIGPRQPLPQPFVVKSAHLTTSAVTVKKAVRLDRSKPAPKDFAHLPEVGAVRPGKTRPRIVLLGDLAQIRRGVATGANAHYFLTDKEAAPLPADSLAAALVRLKGLPGRDLSPTAHRALGAAGVKRWLVDFHAYDDFERPRLPESLASFVNHLEREGLHLRYLLSARGQRWWVPEHIQPAQLLIGPMTKGRFRIANNQIAAIHSNTLYGISLRTPNPRVLSVLHEWLESDEGQLRLEGIARRHATGLLKLEPRALKMLELPARLLTEG